MKNRFTGILPAKAAAAIASVATAGGFAYLFHNGSHVLNAAIISTCAGAVLAGLLLLGSDACIEKLQRRLMDTPSWIAGTVLALVTLYLVYAAGTGTAHVRSTLVIVLYLSMPFLLLAADRGSPRAAWLDAATIIWLWLPIELGLLRRLLPSSNPGADFRYPFAQGLAIDAGIVAFAAWRRFPGIGYRFQVSRRVFSAACKAFVLFAAIAIPLGFAIHFIRYTFAMSKLTAAPAIFLGILLFTAIPEEFLFRGLIQNWLELATRRSTIALLTASIIFGASHLNNGPPVPNYRYFVMASVAGVFYGWAWKTTGSIMASAMTHALVDTAWSVFFR
jgi:uncharacterized protein